MVQGFPGVVVWCIHFTIEQARLLPDEDVFVRDLSSVRQLLVKDAGPGGIRPMPSNGSIANPTVRLSCLYIWLERLVLPAIV